MPFGEGQIHVPDEGSLHARLVLIGEAPGAREISQKRPFCCGPSGRLLREWWEPLGLKREDFYITNFCPYRPAKIEAMGQEEAAYWRQQLFARLAKLTDPWIIIPTGNYALYALTGKGRVSWHTRDGGQLRPGITAHRGSIYSVRLGNRTVKVIPTIHPAATFVRRGEDTKRSVAAQNLRACLADWRRIAVDRHFRDLRLPEREHHIHPTLADVEDFVAEVEQHAQYLAVDIETPPTKVLYVGTQDKRWVRAGTIPEEEIARYKSGKRKGHKKTMQKDGYAIINCIGFSYTPTWSFTIPLVLSCWKDQAVLDQVWRLVAKLLALSVPKVMQSGFYDAFWLRTERWPDGALKVPEIANWFWDTRAMHHALDPTDRHSLEYLTSVYTRTPYYKNECKDPESLAKYSHGEALWTYNGMDACVTLEVFQRLHEQLTRTNQLDFYLRHYAEMLEPLLETSLHGIRVDESRRAARLAELQQRRAELATQMDELAGCSLRGPKGAVSATKLQKLLYDQWGLPKQYKKADKSGRRAVTTDDVALKKLMRRFPDRVEALGKTILEHRAVLKQAEPMAEGKCDPDGRMRCEYHFYTAAGRLASSENARGTGRNLQNIQRGPTRAVFLPDKEEETHE